MSILPRRTSTRLALVLGVVVAVAAIVVLSFVLRDGDVPAPTDGIGDLPTAHLVPEDVALYVGLSTDLDAKSWLGAFALLERLGIEDPLGKVREGLEGEGEVDWDDEIEPFLGGAAVIFLSGFDSDRREVGPPGAVIFHARDASAAEAVILSRRSDNFEERGYRDVAYKVMDEGGVLAVIGDHFIYAVDETTVRAIVDASLGETRSLAASDDFRRLRNALDGEALAFVYVHPGSLMDEALDTPPEEAGPDILSLLGLGDLFSAPMGVVVRSGESAFRVEAVMLGDPGPIVRLLRPRESRFARLVPAETAIFVSTYDIAGVVDDFFGSSGFGQLLRDAVVDGGGEEGEIARIEDLLSLLDGEVAFAIWTSDDGESTEIVLLAEVDDEDRARELLEEFVGDSLTEGETVLSVEDGIAIIGSRAAIEFVRSPSGPTLAGSERYAATVAELDAPLATFAYIDIWRLIASGEDDFDDLDLDGDALGLIVNLVWEDDRVQVEAALSISGD